MPLPPLWALGHQQSRLQLLSRVDGAEDIARTTRRTTCRSMSSTSISTHGRLPRLHLDPTRFPDPAALTARLAGDGIKVVTIVDPGVKYQPRGRLRRLRRRRGA